MSDKVYPTPHLTNSEIENELEKNKNNENKILSRGLRWFILFILCLLHSFLGVSGGVFSSGVKVIKKELNLTDNQFGSFGSINGIGSIIGSFLFTLLNNRISRKYYFLFAMSLNTCMNLCFFFSNNYLILCMARFLSGIGCVVGYCYFPIWVDQFGMQRWKTMMFTLVNLSGNLGMLWGYLINLIIGTENWKLGILTEIACIMTLVFILLLVPDVYLNKDMYYVPVKEGETRENSLFSPYLPKSNDSKEKEESKNTNHNFYNSVLCNPSFLLISFYKSTIAFVAIAQFFWFTDYAQTSLLVSDPKFIFLAYSVSLVFSGMGGVALGGIICTCVGGYDGKYALTTMIIAQTFACCFAFLCTKATTLFYFAVYDTIFNVLNSIGSLIAGGYVLTTVPKDMTGTANGTFMFLLNVLGFMPAPMVYAAVKSYFGESKKAMTLLMYYNFLGLCALFLVSLIKKNKKEDNENEGTLLEDIENEK
jgi:predicted MFS family arabinose efflux permease